MHSPSTLPLTQATRERKRLSGPMSFKILLIIAIVAFLAYCEGYSKIDDSFIYARYISNALAGKGMVYNAGEHVNALSSPLYSYLLLLTSWLLHGNVLLGTIVLSGVFLVLASILAEYLTPFSGLFIASTAYFYYLVGMETSLFVFMILAIITLFQMEKWGWLPLASVLLVLSRFEGGLLVAVVAWRLYQRRVWPTWKAFIPAILLAVCYLLLNHHYYYGVYLPSSATAKLGQGFSGLWGRWPTAFVSHFSMAMVTFQKTKFIMYLVAVFCLVFRAIYFLCDHLCLRCYSEDPCSDAYGHCAAVGVSFRECRVSSPSMAARGPLYGLSGCREVDRSAYAAQRACRSGRNRYFGMVF